MPKVSVITPFYKGEKFIDKAIESILNQSYNNFEYIIVDDGSETGFEKKVKDKFGDKIVYLNKTNGGQASAVNLGIKNSKGEYVAFCDQDDWYLIDKLEKQVEFLEKNKDVAMIYCDAFIGDEKNNILNKTWIESRKVGLCRGEFNNCATKLFKRNFVPAPLTVMIRRSVFDEVGFFDEKFSSAYDYDYWFRILENNYKIDYIETPLAVWRAHIGQESQNIEKAKIMQVGILRKFLKRNKRFILKHPILVFYKMLKSCAALIVSRI